MVGAQRALHRRRDPFEQRDRLDGLAAFLEQVREIAAGLREREVVGVVRAPEARQLRADIFPSMLESSMWAGKVAGIPVDTNNQAVIYNTGLLQQAGVAPPKQGWTWNDFREVALKFVRPDVVPLSMAWAGTWRHWLGTMGGSIITKDFKKITADTPELRAICPDWKSRVSDLESLTHPGFKRWMKRSGIRFIRWRELATRFRRRA